MPATPASPAETEVPDIFTPLKPLLLLLGFGNRALFSRSDDPLPQALTQVTDFGHAEIDRVTALTDAAGLYGLLREAPETYATYLLLGQLVYASPLGPSLVAHLTAEDSREDAERNRAETLRFAVEQAATQLQVFEGFLLSHVPDEARADVTWERAEYRAGVAAVFTEWQHSLGALLLAAPEPVLPFDTAETGWSIRPLELHLHALRLAATIFQLIPTLGTPHFADAVQHLPDFHPQRLQELHQHLADAEPEQELTLSRTQGMLLYIAAHLTLLTLLSDVLEGEGLDDLLLRRRDEYEVTPQMVTLLREGTTIILSAYIDLVRENEADTADFQALEARLSPVLNLAA